MNIKPLVWKVIRDVFLGSLWDIARIVLFPFAVVALLVVWPVCEIIFGGSHDKR